METADVTGLVDLWVQSWRETMPEIDFAARRPWLVGCLADPRLRTIVLVGEAGPQGFVTLEETYVHQLVVAPRLKGSGRAAELVAAAKALSPGALVLDVNQANLRAIRFYLRQGFAITAAGINAASGLATWYMQWGPSGPSAPILTRDAHAAQTASPGREE
jgi:putative acetyltransferase